MDQLPKLSSLTLAILPCPFTSKAFNHHPGSGQNQPIRRAASIFKHVVTRRVRLRTVCMPFKPRIIGTLGVGLPCGGPSLEACVALEKALLSVPDMDVQFDWTQLDRCRAGRAEFWSPIVKAAFPRLYVQWSRTLPQSKFDQNWTILS